MSNMESRPNSPETVVNNDTAAGCWMEEWSKGSKGETSSNSNSNNFITNSPPMWAGQLRIFHIAHTPCGASTQHSKHERLWQSLWKWKWQRQWQWQWQWPMLICIVILAGCFVRWLAVLLRFIGRHIGTFSISATTHLSLYIYDSDCCGNILIPRNEQSIRSQGNALLKPTLWLFMGSADEKSNAKD